MRNSIRLMVLLVALLAPAPSLAITLFASPDGDGGYIIEGENAPGVQVIDITIGYDKGSLASPHVEAQGGTLTDVSTDTPGMLTASVFRENPDSAFELHLKFEKKSDLPGLINYVTGIARDTEGKNFPAEADTRALSIQTAAPAETGGEPGSGSDAAASAQEPAAEREKSATANLTVGDGEREGAGKKNPAATEEPNSPGDGMITPVKMEKSVLQRFREYKGVKGLKEYAALFERGPREAVVQEPAIALSDGKTPVRITLELESAGGSSLNFSLSDAKLVSLEKTGGKSWVITALPSEGTWQASLYLSTGRKLIEFPLVVAPPMKIEYGTNERNFLSELDAYVAAQSTTHQRESSQSHRHFHEYVFTANYLAQQAITRTKKGAR